MSLRCIWKYTQMFAYVIACMETIHSISTFISKMDTLRAVYAIMQPPTVKHTQSFGWKLEWQKAMRIKEMKSLT